MKAIAVVVALCCSSCVAQQLHLLSFENRPRCQNGVCYAPSIRKGTGTCVPVAHTRDGHTICLTATHNIDPQQDQYIRGRIGGDYKVTILAASGFASGGQYRQFDCDLSAVLIRERFDIVSIARPPVAGSTVELNGLLSRRLQ